MRMTMRNCSLDHTDQVSETPSESTDADYDKVNFQDKRGCDIQEYNKSDINDIY